MNLDINEKLFVVTGASSGFGRSIAQLLLAEGASVIINGRNGDKLRELAADYGDRVELVQGDITTDAVISEIIRKLNGRFLSGIVINAGGPPAGRFMDLDVSDWDQAYELVLRWKVKLTREILPVFKEQSFGRMIFIESVSVKQPVENLILSNSLRMAVVGMVKTLSQEVASQGITANIVAPGYHKTAAINRLIEAKKKQGFSEKEAWDSFEQATSVKFLGDPDDLASLVAWILSEKSKFVTGQVLYLDGGGLKSSL